jgi:hypothetical protein
MLARVAALRSVSARFLLGAVALLLSLFAIELAFRIVGYDFDRKSDALARVPIFFRRPTVPVGEAFYRRSGPDHWEGRVLTTMMRERGVPERYLPAEAPVSIAYDAFGFRNPEDLDDWEIVLVGDSFTELGHLADRDLVSSRLADALGVGVKNLGVSYTGTFTHAAYLREFGQAPSARLAVLAFFEGNDIGNVMREWKWIEAARKRKATLQPAGRTGDAEGFSPLAPQSSFLLALFRQLTDSLNEPRKPIEHDALFVEGNHEVPITLGQSPPALRKLGVHRRQLIEEALGAFAEAAREFGMEPWLLYVQCKRRVLAGHARAVDRAAGPIFRARGVRAYAESAARARGFRFVDPTSALRAEAGAGRLPYNAVMDTHVNALGARVIADVLADALRERGARRP